MQEHLPNDVAQNTKFKSRVVHQTLISMYRPAGSVALAMTTDSAVMTQAPKAQQMPKVGCRNGTTEQLLNDRNGMTSCHIKVRMVRKELTTAERQPSEFQ